MREGGDPSPCRVAWLAREARRTSEVSRTTIIAVVVAAVVAIAAAAFVLTSGSGNNDKGPVEPQTFTVAFDSNGGSAVPSQTVKSGDRAVQPVTIWSDHEFDGWYTSLSGGSKYDFSQAVTGSMTLFAHWTDAFKSIGSKADFMAIADDIDGNYRLTSDIDLGEWTDPLYIDFNGTLDGNGHEISYSFTGTADWLEYITSSGGSVYSYGLFETLDKDAEVRNLKVRTNVVADLPFVDVQVDAGMIAASSFGGVIEGCTVSGDVEYKWFVGYTESSRFTIKGAQAEVVSDVRSFSELEGYEFQSFEGDVVLSYDNVSLDCGRMSYDPETEMFLSKEAKVSGRSTAVYSDLESVRGRIVNLRIGQDQDRSFDSHELTYTMKDGSVLTDVMDIGDTVSEAVTVSGTVQYVVANGYTSVTAMQTRAATEGKPIDLSVAGSGRLVLTTMDDSIRLSKGTACLSGIMWMDDLRVNAYGLNGAYLVLDGTNGEMRIEAEPGYSLDPSTYEGFFVKDGKLFLDESKAVDGVLDLVAESVPDEYRLKIDGVSSEVAYRSMVTRDVASDVLWFADSDGTIHGAIEDGAWEYQYDFLGDLDLKSVKGKVVSAEPGRTVRSSSDSLYFLVPESGQRASVQTPSGLIFVVDPYMEAGGRVAASVSETVYDGYRAYDITADRGTQVMFPVKSEDTMLFHVVDGIPVEMAGHYVIEDDDRMYLEAFLSSYSIYYVTEKAPEKGSESNLLPICLAVAIVALAAIAIAYMIRRSRRARGS